MLRAVGEVPRLLLAESGIDHDLVFYRSKRLLHRKNFSLKQRILIALGLNLCLQPSVP